VVEVQGGRVAVESTLGKGSTFSAVLPREVREHANPSAPDVLANAGTEP
jgi:signal transduction histidine kinase